MVTNSIFEGRLQNLIIEIISEFLMYCTVPCLVLFLSPNLVSDLGDLIPPMGAMWVVVAAARVAAGEVVVGALVPILVPVVGLVQIVVAPAASAGGGGSSAAAAGIGGSSAAAAADGGR